MNLKILAMWVAGILVAENAAASLILTIESYTTDELSFTISGTMDEDQSSGFLALKNDWQNNVGVHTELFTADTATYYDRSISLYMNDELQNSYYLFNNTDTYTDSIYWYNLDTISAGTTFSGSVTVTCVNGFDPDSNNNLQLVSGYSGADWARLEAMAVPEPATMSMVGIVAGVSFFIRRRFCG